MIQRYWDCFESSITNDAIFQCSFFCYFCNWGDCSICLEGIAQAITRNLLKKKQISKGEISRKEQIFTVICYVLWFAAEPSRLYFGYTGNLREKVSSHPIELICKMQKFVFIFSKHEYLSILINIHQHLEIAEILK